MATAFRDIFPEISTQFVNSDAGTETWNQIPLRKAEREAKNAAHNEPRGTGAVDVRDTTSTSEVIPLPRFRTPKHREKVFSASKEWEGVITRVTSSSIIAELRDITCGTDDTDTLEIPLSDVPRADQHLLREGAIFRYLIGYAKNYGGTLSTKRHVYIRRGKQKIAASSSEDHWVHLMEKLRG